jgi:hypothetical protein
VSEPAAITIRGLPPSVTRKQVQEALALLGIDPANTVSIHMDPSAVRLEVYADGRPPGHTEFPNRVWRWADHSDNVATHRLTIPIVDKDPSA